MKRATPAWRRYLRFWGSDTRGDIEDELAFHIESRVQQLMRGGLAEADARTQAARSFGDVTQIRAELQALDQQHERGRRRSLWLDDAWADVRLGYRWLARRPWFALAVVSTLALGIAASTTIFGLVRGVLLRPLP